MSLFVPSGKSVVLLTVIVSELYRMKCLTSQEEKQLFVCDQYFADDEAEKSFVIAGKEITAKLLAEALHSLPEEKREAVLLYYFFDMSDVEIAKLHNIPRSTVQYRRTSSFELLKRYLEERAYDENEW